jgi:hypothetical protein
MRYIYESPRNTVQSDRWHVWKLQRMCYLLNVFIMTACNLTAMAFERKPNPTERQRVNNLQTSKENIKKRELLKRHQDPRRPQQITRSLASSPRPYTKPYIVHVLSRARDPNRFRSKNPKLLHNTGPSLKTSYFSSPHLDLWQDTFLSTVLSGNSSAFHALAFVELGLPGSPPSSQTPRETSVPVCQLAHGAVSTYISYILPNHVHTHGISALVCHSKC